MQVGLCHISEFSDDHVDNIDTYYKAGDKVVAKILKASFSIVSVPTLLGTVFW